MIAGEIFAGPLVGHFSELSPKFNKDIRDLHGLSVNTAY